MGHVNLYGWGSVLSFNKQGLAIDDTGNAAVTWLQTEYVSPDYFHYIKMAYQTYDGGSWVETNVSNSMTYGYDGMGPQIGMNKLGETLFTWIFNGNASAVSVDYRWFK